MKVLGYIRVSTQGQAKDGYSLKYQEDEIKAYCKEQGLNLLHIFRDEGISGAKLNEEAFEIDRVGLREMLAHLSSVQIHYVVVLNTSRLWRSDIIKVLIQCVCFSMLVLMSFINILQAVGLLYGRMLSSIQLKVYLVSYLSTGCFGKNEWYV